MRKKDLVLGSVVVIIAAALMFFMKLPGEQTADTVMITVDGEVYGEYSLDMDRTVEIDNKYGHNTVTIHNGKAYMTEADCRDGYCRQQGKIDEDKETVVCLPHRLVVEVLSGKDGSEPDAVSK